MHFIQPVSISGQMHNLDSRFPEEINHLIQWATLHGSRFDQAASGHDTGYGNGGSVARSGA